MNKKLFVAPPENKEEPKNMCGGYGNCQNAAQGDHTCPFSEEIHGDCETTCNCCDDCQHECAMDI